MVVIYLIRIETLMVKTRKEKKYPDASEVSHTPKRGIVIGKRIRTGVEIWEG